MARVAVIGGGAAGLAAAWTLRSRGDDVVLFERQPVCGGVLSSDELDGAVIDTGVQLLGGNYTELFRIAREAGADDLIVKSPGRDALWRDDRIHAITYGSIGSMVVSGALPGRLKLKLAAKYVPFLTREGARLDVNDLTRGAGLLMDRESIGAWGLRELGEDFVEYLVYPLLAAYYGNVPEMTTAGLYHALARVGMDVSVYAIRGGVGRLVSRLVQALIERGVDVRCGVEVTVLEQRGSRHVPVTAEGGEAFDRVVVAVPPRAAERLLATHDALRQWLSGVRTRPATVIAFLTDGSIRTDFFGLSVPRGNGVVSDVVAFCNESHKVSGLVPADAGVLVVMPAPAIAEEVARLAPEAVVDRIMPALDRAMPNVRRMIRHARVYRHDRGYVQFYPGYVHHLAQYPKTARQPGLSLAGDYLRAPTVEGAIRSGVEAGNEG